MSVTNPEHDLIWVLFYVFIALITASLIFSLTIYSTPLNLAR